MKKYDKEFKREAIRKYLDGQSIARFQGKSSRRARRTSRTLGVGCVFGNYALTQAQKNESSAVVKLSIKDLTAAQQVIGREGETATFLSRCLLNSKLRVGGFAPRQFGR
jgi:transposase-like protein